MVSNLVEVDYHVRSVEKIVRWGGVTKAFKQLSTLHHVIYKIDVFWSTAYQNVSILDPTFTI